VARSDRLGSSTPGLPIPANSQRITSWRCASGIELPDNLVALADEVID
jgi:hypothetical protein